jgi:hypothetical protein
MYFHGQNNAQLIRNQSVYEHERSLLITIISPLLFLAPDAHLREIVRLWTDGTILGKIRGDRLIMQSGEWGDTIRGVRSQRRNVIGSSVSRDCYLVDCAASGQHWFSCYPWRSRFKY